MVDYVQQAPRHITVFQSLPLYLTRFVGREQESAALSSLLLETRLLTLVGAGGIGKTRLALHVAERVSASFADGVCLIEAGSLTVPQLLPQALASLLNIDTSQDAPITTLLLSALRECHLLLIFDTCEHLLPACADFVTALLQACPHLRILATSREPLQATDEVVWRVASLSSPQPESQPSFAELAGYEAVQLFCERASDIDPRFCLTPQNASAVVAICQQLDGLPLALELAAARLTLLTVEQVAARLHAQLRLLTNSTRSVTSRLKTLQTTLDWSYALLTPIEQDLFAALAIFAGSWNLPAAEKVCAGIIPDSSCMGEALTNLVNKSLVVAEEQEGSEERTGEIRYRLQDTMHQYALQQLQQKGFWLQLCRQHYDWYLHLAEQAQIHMYGAERVLWLQCLEGEQADLRIALTRVIEAGDLDAGTRLANTLSHFWIMHNHFSEGRHWFEGLLAADQEEARLSPALRARVLFGVAEFARYQGAYERARTFLETQMELLHTLADPESIAETQTYLGLVLGLQAQYEAATQLCQTSLAFYRAAKHTQGITTTLVTLAFVSLARGEPLQAIELCEEACQLLRATGDYHYLLYALFTLIQALLFRNDGEPARQYCREALQIASKHGQTYGQAACFGLVAGIVGLGGQPALAARFFGAAQALQDRIKVPHPPAGRALLERMVLSIRTTLGKEQFLLHYTAGLQSPLEQMLREAEQVLEAASPLVPQQEASSVSPLMAALSKREREILALVAAGLTDVQIAQYVSLSPRTVSKHLQSIYSKLAINSRSAATRLALEHGLV
ncbi:MAG TPA: LuxR C-terminal-related transcriptional regulator [Ktedonobacteraceae bacterium]|jgi:predicted ATPase/DNA-binding CsgD family transcriptional regulator|nr:LuxR C-terminal-related transcriptional regulator [Ktedonobacteraceae bacterium]